MNVQNDREFKLTHNFISLPARPVDIEPLAGKRQDSREGFQEGAAVGFLLGTLAYPRVAQIFISSA